MRSTAVALVLLLSLAACGTDPGATPSSSGTAPVASKLEFTAKTLDGNAFIGTTLAGNDTVLWFWAPWCTKCRREAPYVAKTQADNPDVVFVGVAGLGETDDMRDFVEDYNVGEFQHLADLDGSLWQRFGVTQQPAYAFIDDTGTVEVVRGELGADGLAERVATLTGN